MMRVSILIIVLLLNYNNIANASPIKEFVYDKFVDQKIERGLNYLYHNQLPNGEFPIYISLSPDMNNNSNVSTFFKNVSPWGEKSITFDTGLILHTLNLADRKVHNKIKNRYDKRDDRYTDIIYDMRAKAITFLLNNMDRHNVWKFFGKDHPSPPDIDDTSVIFAALVENDVNISDESLDYMFNYRTSDGIFYVWINSDEWFNSSSPFYNKPEFRFNQIDHTINANALYAYSLRNRFQDNVTRYLIDVIENESFINGSAYYPSPYIFIYLVTKSYSEGNVKEFKPHLDKIKEYLLEQQNIDGSWGNDLNTALAVNALINMDYKGDRLEKAVEHILNTQKNDGSWDINSFYIRPSDPVIPTLYFGSQELTTSFNLEALIKYRS